MKTLNEMSVDEMVLVFDWIGASECSIRALESRLKYEMANRMSTDQLIGAYEKRGVK